MTRTILWLGTVLCLGCGAALAQDGIRTVPMQFAPGTTGATVQDVIVGRESISYTLGAQAGQRMDIRLSSPSTSVYFNLYAPGTGPGDAALASGEMQPEINRYSDVLPASGTYTINVFLYRNAARDGEEAGFQLDVSVSALEDAAAPPAGDYAEGLAGGPDYWRAQTSGGALNLRAGPSAAAAIVMSVENGTGLRNMGCRMNEGRRWCRVATINGPNEGWAAGDFLVEGASAPPAQKTDDALVAGTSFNATGQIACALEAGAAMAQCEFGVTRETPGTGTITITRPDGSVRVIGYENAWPAWYDQSQADGEAEIRVDQQGDRFLVTIGPERYELFEAIMTGG